MFEKMCVRRFEFQREESKSLCRECVLRLGVTVKKKETIKSDDKLFRFCVAVHAWTLCSLGHLSDFNW